MNTNTSVSARYKSQVESGNLLHDPAQIKVSEALDALIARLQSPPKSSWFKKPVPIRGIYLWGDVGRGKSMLMDLFVKSLPARISSQRVHFHAFMRQAHHLIHLWRQMDVAERRQLTYFVKGADDDPIPHLARYFALESKVLAFDELHVTQIADAMLLSRLFGALFDQGVVVVATSNRIPEDLYLNGINRELFMPFIRILREHCEVFELASPDDYRLKAITVADIWHLMRESDDGTHMLAQWQALAAGREAEKKLLTIQGRELIIENTIGDAAWMTFGELCDRPLGPADYLELCENFRILFLDNIPQLNAENRNQAARFVSLIDVIYETNTILIASAATEPQNLYKKGDGAFEFQRTVSRLIEMQGEAYLKKNSY